MDWDDEDFFFWRRHKPAKSVEGGIKARAAKFGESWWSAKWLDSLPSSRSSRWARGRSYARKGQITDFEVTPGTIAGKVQGSADQPYEIEIRTPPVTGSRLQEIRDTIKKQPGISASLLNREMPPELENVFQQSHSLLYPATAELLTVCDCPDAVNPCKHIAAVAYLFSLELERDPFLLLQFRGLDRAVFSSGIPQAMTFTQAPAAPPEPLPEDPRAFWKTFRVQPGVTFEAPKQNAVLVRQLGPFPLWRGQADLMKFIDALYAAASAEAKRILSRE